jgi:hypothetical protein
MEYCIVIVVCTIHTVGRLHCCYLIRYAVPMNNIFAYYGRFGVLLKLKDQCSYIPYPWISQTFPIVSSAQNNIHLIVESL